MIGTGRGDMRRLESVFDASYRRLVGQLYAVCGDLGEAEDVVSEAFVRAADRERQFDRTDNPEAWLRTVAVNVARTRHQRRVVGTRLTRRATPPGSAQVELAPERAALVAALRQLPAVHREALALHYLADLPLAEVADTLGVPVGTVKARLSRGRRQLAALLADTLTPEDSDA
jgi:RNA polymerase sigma-70 factor (ECF subfamily)